ncbi:hypothetical protein T439DRAFT_348799 [Meredithblackwellia eburnea MCA 4105]
MVQPKPHLIQILTISLLVTLVHAVPEARPTASLEERKVVNYNLAAAVASMVAAVEHKALAGKLNQGQNGGMNMRGTWGKTRRDQTAGRRRAVRVRELRDSEEDEVDLA